MVIHLEPELQDALIESARQRGVSPETLALEALRERFLNAGRPIQPRDEWERRLLEVASDCSISLPDSAFSSDGLYE